MKTKKPTPITVFNQEYAVEMFDMLQEFVLLQNTNMTKKQVQLRIDLAEELITKITKG